MLQAEAKKIAISKFLGYPENERTDQRATAIAMRLAHELKFRCSGDPYQHIKGWLNHFVKR